LGKDWYMAALAVSVEDLSGTLPRDLGWRGGQLSRLLQSLGLM
jgi:hypothetical protein